MSLGTEHLNGLPCNSHKYVSHKYMIMVIGIC